MDKEKLALNLATLPKMLSAWVMTLAGGLGVLWVSLPEPQQKLIIEHSWLPPWAYPIALTVLGLVARVLPQSNITPTEAEGKSADAPPTEEKQ